MMVLLNILKIIGIILLCVLLLILLLLLLLLFVPIRYRLKAVRKAQEDAVMRGEVKITWFLHLISASFRYPEAAYLKVRIFGIPIFSTEKKADDKADDKADMASEEGKENTQQKDTDNSDSAREEEKTKNVSNIVDEDIEKKLEEKLQKEEEEPTIIRFFKKLLEKLINIKYTILKICDKIRHVIKNIRYYVAVVRSNCFQRAFSLCRTEVFSLLKSIMPRKIKGDFLIGTGDPASTAQVLAIHGMLYPIVGNNINITPDFENTVIEGDLLIKGKITIFKALKTAIKVYFNQDVSKVLRLLKREAA